MKKSISNTLIRIANFLSNSQGINDQQLQKLNNIAKSTNLVNYFMFAWGAQKFTKNILEMSVGLDPKSQYYQIIYKSVKQFIQKIIDSVPKQILDVLSHDIKSFKQCTERFPKIKQNLSKLNTELQKQILNVIDKITYSEASLQKIVNEWKI